ncbi:MAG: tRNA (mnm(5)s(2)U34)-methyltransferase [Anaerovoracaceae bacterium]
MKAYEKDNDRINLITKTTELAMNITQNYVNQNGRAIDATAGNGHDTLALARKVGKNGYVLALDIQQEAIDNSRLLLESHKETGQVKLVQGSHEFLKEHWQQYAAELKERGMIEDADGFNPDAVVFNLGYLPKGDKNIVTKTDSSVKAVKAALELVKPDGIVTVTLYGGHEEGAKEKQAVLDFAASLNSGEFHVVYASMHNQGEKAPEILWITKKQLTK